MYLVIILLFIFLTVSFFMKKDNHRLKIEEYTIQSPNIPTAFHKCKIVFLTDLHNNLFGVENERLILKIRECNPDYIMISGDFIVGGENFDGTISLHLLEQLVKDYPVYYANGNHEKNLSLYTETKARFQDYQESLKKMGVHYLVNERIKITRGADWVEVAGLDLDLEYYQKIWLENSMTDFTMGTLLGKSNDVSYQILLAHNPMYFPWYAKWGADLVLSGHIHGGIIILPKIGGVIAPNYEFFPKYDSGLFQEGQSHMVLSRGLGVHTINMRAFNVPEISAITLIKG